MSNFTKPPINPDKSVAGIAVDPRTLDRVIPESRRPDGSIRKELKVRPGFTPQEDVKRFRGTKQSQMDATQLPKGHILGWISPSAATQKSGTAEGVKQVVSKSAKKNDKKKEKKKAQKEQDHLNKIRDSWEVSDEEEGVGKASAKSKEKEKAALAATKETVTGVHTADKPNWAAAPGTEESVSTPVEESSTQTDDGDNGLADELEKLNVG